VWIEQVMCAAREIADLPDAVGAAPYFTDASVLTPALGNPPTTIVGPGELALAHQTDEYCFVTRIEQATELYLRLVRSWCNI